MSPPAPAPRSRLAGYDNISHSQRSTSLTPRRQAAGGVATSIIPLRKRKPVTRQKTWSEPTTEEQFYDAASELGDQSSNSNSTATASQSTSHHGSAAPMISVAKTINQLLHNPSNRCCADCRSALVDSSQVHASFRPPHLNGRDTMPKQLTRSDLMERRNFSDAHHAFAPPFPTLETTRNSSASANHVVGKSNKQVTTNGNRSKSPKRSNGRNELDRYTHHGPLNQSTKEFANITEAARDFHAMSQSTREFTIHNPYKASDPWSPPDAAQRQPTSPPQEQPPLPPLSEPPNGSFVARSAASSPSRSSPPPKSKSPVPNRQSSARAFHMPAIDPASLVYRHVPGHGVFLCAQCAHAHRVMGDKVTIVRHVQEYQSWTAEEALAMKRAGGNTMGWQIYEAYLPEPWRRRRPNHSSQVSDRLVFCRAKYEAMGFVLPPLGGSPTSIKAWKRLVQSNDWARQNGAAAVELNNLIALTLHRRHGMDQYERHNGGKTDNTSGMPLAAEPISALPERLVDYFCVVGSSGFLDPRLLQREDLDLSTLTGPEDLDLEPRVIDCYPSTTHHPDMEFPEHVATFVMPEGCRPSDSQKSPVFFTFVLTAASGRRLYGASLQLYDEAIETQELQEIIEKSGYTGAYPSWLSTPPSVSGGLSVDSSRNSSDYVDIVYLPKCLVVLSHYQFFDLFRNFLLQLYRITLVEAPLPIERFIANFCCEVPLPPLGKVEVKFGFTVKDIWSIQRPPENQLPLASFSYKPIFACLSPGNIMTLLGCLMEESRVALCSRHYALLAPIAEALLSFLFPLQWQGMYIPVMPYALLDILDAPVPFLVGLHIRYLIETKPDMRPQGVVFVDIDRDIVHLGYNEESNAFRLVPALPERGALKLRAKLEEHGSSVYVTPDNAKLEGNTITSGYGRILSDSKREAYATTFYSPSAAASIKESSSLPGNEEFRRRNDRGSTVRRRNVLRTVDKAYQENELLTPITGFLSEQGQLYGREPARQIRVHRSGMGKIFNLRRLRSQSSLAEEDASAHFSGHGSVSFTMTNHAHSHQHGFLLDMDEPPGFNSSEIRNAFLRFFVSLLKGYEQFLNVDNHNNLFRVEEFLADLNLSVGSYQFVEKVVKTQMFQRFLEERQNDPCDPLFLFFDECIIAKQNRSRMLNVRQKDTPFLDDPSGAISETFTPPPPSNWGLPDDGRSYHYGSFPKFNQDLFGKVRKPMKWKAERRGSALRTLPAVVLPNSSNQSPSSSWQHEILARSLAPAATTPTAFYWAAKQGYKSLESAIGALSQSKGNANTTGTWLEDSWSSLSGRKEPGGKAKPSKEKKRGDFMKAGFFKDLSAATLTSAQAVLVNARRIKGIILEVVCVIQSTWRMQMARRKYVRFLKALRLLQYKWRRHVPEGLSEMDQLERARQSIAKLQRLCRSFLLIQGFRKKRAAIVLIQRWFRGAACRKHCRKLERACKRIQMLVRSRRAQFGLKLLRDLIAKVQARSRGFLTRKRMSSLNKRRMSRYREQIFLLWSRVHTPLSYRTKFWPMISEECGFLRLRIAESELERLWIFLEVDFNSNDYAELEARENHAEELRLAKQLGITDHTFWRCLKVQQLTVSVLLFPAEERRSTELRLASDRVEAERIQIYHRISADRPETAALLCTLLGLFNIDMKEKNKKYRLAEIVWMERTQANQSETLMMQVFPELEEASNVIFNPPPKKVLKRFRNVNPTPPRLGKAHWAHSILRDQISRNVREVAINALQGVGQPSEKTNEGTLGRGMDLLRYSKAATEERYISRRRASMAVSVGPSSVKDVQTYLIGDLLTSRTWEGK
ncbi:DENN domain-containing protein 5B [Seminavis robusta]|uniref:DENN domain-containing protein 5B n=1 Tax=Seminavis robusta TaxID=568900 RepID=A0A9N8DS48_9STRA|nr:DENN domain-containing protein 5B [Seminavis robusta]|eukprot:Sro330_g119010.1 DENN domain-containing protein 5B (1807) ;mRNA; f:65232-70824